MAVTFDISPERRASQLHFIYRQLFVTPAPVTRRDADLNGKTAIITGANVGLGFEAAGQILDLGGKLILAVRDERKGEAAQRRLSEGRDLAPGSIRVWRLDLSSYDSITAFVNRAKGLDHLDIAILNAGLVKDTESFLSTTGYEETFQVNYLSNMLLTILLLPIINSKRTGSDPGYICMASSDTAAWVKFEERSSTPLLQAFKEKSAGWNSQERYGTTKLLGQLFLSELAKHVSSSFVTVNCANPGFCSGSEIAREASGIGRLIYNAMSALLGRTCAAGARSYVHAVTTLGKESHGQYIEDGKVQPMAVLAYKPEGLQLARKLYEETLDELSFAGARGILDEFSRLRFPA